MRLGWILIVTKLNACNNTFILTYSRDAEICILTISCSKNQILRLFNSSTFQLRFRNPKGFVNSRKSRNKLSAFLSSYQGLFSMG